MTVIGTVFLFIGALLVFAAHLGKSRLTGDQAKAAWAPTRGSSCLEQRSS